MLPFMHCRIQVFPYQGLDILAYDPRVPPKHVFGCIVRFYVMLQRLVYEKFYFYFMRDLWLMLYLKLTFFY